MAAAAKRHVFSDELEARFVTLGALKKGWDDDDETQPMYPENLICARRALELILAAKPEIDEPEMGAVPDGRLDLSWYDDRLDVYFTLDLEDKELRIHARKGRELRDLTVAGDDIETRARALATILLAELE